MRLRFARRSQTRFLPSLGLGPTWRGVVKGSCSLTRMAAPYTASTLFQLWSPLICTLPEPSSSFQLLLLHRVALVSPASGSVSGWSMMRLWQAVASAAAPGANRGI